MNSTTLRAERFTDAPPDEAKHESKKLRIWCRGKVGVRHEGVWQFNFEYIHYREKHPMDWQIKKCVNCGRTLGWRNVPSNRPSHQEKLR